MSIEERLKGYMEQGWNIQIECKGAGRGYGLTYEASAYLTSSQLGEVASLFRPRHAIGNTVGELLDNLKLDSIQPKPSEDTND